MSYCMNVFLTFFKKLLLCYVHVVSTFYIYPHITIKYFIMDLCDFFPLRVCFLAILKWEIPSQMPGSTEN
jgi:hypothetical protein